MKLSITVTGTLPTGANLNAAFESVLRKSLQGIGNKLAERASALAPLKTGDLTASLKADTVQKHGDQYQVNVSSDIPYALAMEANQVKSPIGPIIYGMGPGTIAKDAAFSGPEPLGVGGGYITRAANYNAPLFLLKLKTDLERGIPAVLGGGQAAGTITP